MLAGGFSQEVGFREARDGAKASDSNVESLPGGVAAGTVRKGGGVSFLTGVCGSRFRNE